MLKSKKWLTSLAVGTALMGAGLAVGLVQTQVAQPVAVQAKTKMKTVKIPNLIYKDGKTRAFVAKVPYGKTTAVKQPKYKGYVDMNEGTISAISVYKDGKVGWGANHFVFMKKLSAKQQKMNAKSKQAVTIHGKLPYIVKGSTKERKVKYTVKGLVGTRVSIKAPKVAGYKSAKKKIYVGIVDKKTGFTGWSEQIYIKK
ncbi:hypothetical protein [Lactiplantibacillus songbeiensis]|uniref:Extracellular protein n=1 Tax=Lactiplantibacillus songbeiensis TaxID=2559920 RepID=A0ABW4BZC0_9LACO|nr:hypothetical protein [Lactiplantibacillus songbeiensis]